MTCRLCGVKTSKGKACERCRATVKAARQSLAAALKTTFVEKTAEGCYLIRPGGEQYAALLFVDCD